MNEGWVLMGDRPKTVDLPTLGQELSEAGGLVKGALGGKLDDEKCHKICTLFESLHSSFKLGLPSELGPVKELEWKGHKSDFDALLRSAKARKWDEIRKAILTCKTRQAERWKRVCDSVEAELVAKAEEQQLETALRAATCINRINCFIRESNTEPSAPRDLLENCDAVADAIRTVMGSSGCYDPLVASFWAAHDTMALRTCQEIDGKLAGRRKADDVAKWCKLTLDMRAKLPDSPDCDLSREPRADQKLKEPAEIQHERAQAKERLEQRRARQGRIHTYLRRRKLVRRIEKCALWVQKAGSDGLLDVDGARRTIRGYTATIQVELEGDLSPELQQIRQQFKALMGEIEKQARTALLDYLQGRGDLREVAGWAGSLCGKKATYYLAVVEQLRRMVEVQQRIEEGTDLLEPANQEWIVRLFCSLEEELKESQEVGQIPVKKLKPMHAIGTVRDSIVESVVALLNRDRSTSSSMREALKWAEAAKEMGIEQWQPRREWMVKTTDEQAKHYLDRVIEGEADLLEVLQGWSTLRAELGEPSVQESVDLIVQLNRADALIKDALDEGLSAQSAEQIAQLFNGIPADSKVAARHQGIGEQISGFVADEQMASSERIKWIDVARSIGRQVEEGLERSIHHLEVQRLLPEAEAEGSVAPLLENAWTQQQWRAVLWDLAFDHMDADERWRRLAVMEKAGIGLEEQLCSERALSELERLLAIDPMVASAVRRMEQLYPIIQKGGQGYTARLMQMGKQIRERTKNLFAALFAGGGDPVVGECWARMVGLIAPNGRPVEDGVRGAIAYAHKQHRWQFKFGSVTDPSVYCANSPDDGAASSSQN